MNTKPQIMVEQYSEKSYSKDISMRIMKEILLLFVWIMKACYFIIQIMLTLIGSLGVCFLMFINNINLKELLHEEGLVSYILLKNTISMILLLLYTIIVNMFIVIISWVVAKIFGYQRISYTTIKKVLYWQFLYYAILFIAIDIYLFNYLSGISIL